MTVEVVVWFPGLVAAEAVGQSSVVIYHLFVYLVSYLIRDLFNKSLI